MIVRPRGAGLATFAAVLALAVAGCGEEQPAGGGGEQAAPEEPSGDPVATVEISETEFALDPANPTVDQSGLIEFVAINDGQIEHDLKVEGPEEEAVTELLAPGDRGSISLELPPGEHVMYCTVANHRELGMEGTVTVAEGGSGGGGSEDGSGGGGSEDGSGGGGSEDGSGTPSY